MKTLLVTGGAGFIGTNLVFEALARGYKVVNLDALTYAGNLSNLKSVEGNKNYQFVKGSIADAKIVGEVFNEYRPNIVLNLAAESHVDRSIDQPDEFIHTNINGAFTMLWAALKFYQKLSGEEKASFRFVQVSTDEVYGSVPEGEFTEDSQYQPNSPYSASKAAADHLTRAFSKTYGLPALITNCTNNYGPYQFPEKLIPLTILNALSEKPLPIYGNGQNIRDWLHVVDHCKGILTVAEKGIPGEKYNISSENRKMNIEIVETICTILDRIKPRKSGESYKKLMQFVQDRPGHDERYAMSAKKTREKLSWSPTVGFEEGIEKTIQWYLDHMDWCEDIRAKKYQGERLGNVRVS